MTDGWISIWEMHFYIQSVHLFWSKYRPCNQALVDYLCPASLKASLHSCSAISHFSLNPYLPHNGISGIWVFMVSKVPQMTERLNTPIVSPWTVGLMVTERQLNHWDNVSNVQTSLAQCILWVMAKKIQDHESSSHIWVSNICLLAVHSIITFPENFPLGYSAVCFIDLCYFAKPCLKGDQNSDNVVSWSPENKNNACCSGTWTHFVLLLFKKYLDAHWYVKITYWDLWR